MEMDQIKAGEPFDFLGIKLVPYEVDGDSINCDGCFFYRMIGLSMGCMNPRLACAPDTNEYGQNLIIKRYLQQA